MSSPDRAAACVLHEQRREVERLLGSKNECSSTLHAKGTALIRTHERLIAALEQIAAIPDNVSSSPSATRIAQEALNART